MRSRLVKTLGVLLSLGALSCTNVSPSLEERSSQQEIEEEKSFHEYGRNLFLYFSNGLTHIGFSRNKDCIRDIDLVYEPKGYNDQGHLVLELKQVWDDKNKDGKRTENEIFQVNPKNLPYFAIKYGQRLILQIEGKYANLLFDRNGNNFGDLELTYELIEVDKRGSFILELREIWENNEEGIFEKREINPIQQNHLERIV